MARATGGLSRLLETCAHSRGALGFVPRFSAPLAAVLELVRASDGSAEMVRPGQPGTPPLGVVSGKPRHRWAGWASLLVAGVPGLEELAAGHGEPTWVPARGRNGLGGPALRTLLVAAAIEEVVLWAHALPGGWLLVTAAHRGRGEPGFAEEELAWARAISPLLGQLGRDAALAEIVAGAGVQAPVALVDAEGKLLYADRPAEVLLRADPGALAAARARARCAQGEGRVLPGGELLLVLDPRASPSSSPAAALSPRESEVAALLDLGLPYKQIAGQLGTSVSRVKRCVEAIYRKTGASNKAAALRSLRSDPPPG